MVRHLFIVSRDHPWLYAHLLERFEDDPNVGVVLDRRTADRRIANQTGLTHTDRRKKERRRPIAPEDDLRLRSHYIVER